MGQMITVRRLSCLFLATLVACQLGRSQPLHRIRRMVPSSKR
jgi:hypothetical protein